MKKRFRSLLKWLLALAILFALYFTYTGINNYYHEKHLTQILNRLDAEEPGWQWPDRFAKLPQLKKEENAAEEIKAIMRLLTLDEQRMMLGMSQWSNDFFAFERSTLAGANQAVANQGYLNDRPNALLPGINRESWAKLLAASPCPEALQRARQLKRYSAGLFPHKYRPFLAMSLLPDVQCIRNLVKLLSWNAALEVEANRPEQAADDISAILQIVRVFDHDPFTICAMVRSALVQVAAHATHRLLAQSTHTSPVTLKRLQDEFLREETLMSSLPEAYRWERAMHDYDVKLLHTGEYTLTAYLELYGTMFNSGTPITPWAWLDSILKKAYPSIVLGFWAQPRHFAQERADLLNYYDRVITWSASPEHQLLENYKTMAAQGPGVSPFIFRHRNFTGTIEDYKKNSYLHVLGIARAILTYRAHCRTITTALAAERYRINHNTWPTTWEQLTPHYLPNTLLDPFTGKPLLLKTLPDGFIIYTVGYNNTDDNGKIFPTELQIIGDIGYRLWNPTHRRLDMTKEFKKLEDELNPKNE